MASTLHVLSRVQARPGMRDRLLPIMVGLLEPTRRERGCVRYDLMQSRVDPDAFVFIEEWEDEAALQEHLRDPDVQQAFRDVQPFVAEPPALTWYSSVGPPACEHPASVGPAPH